MLYFLYKIGRRFALKLSRKTCYRIAVVLADVYYFFARNDRKNIGDNLKVVLGTGDHKAITRHTKKIFRNFAKYLADFFRFSQLSGDHILRFTEIEGKKNLDEALKRGKGVISLSAHLGNWELGAAIVASMGYPLYVIALNHKDTRINDFFLQQRAVADVKVIPIGSQLKNCFKVLRKNAVLGIAGDRTFSNHGIWADFFGRPAKLPQGPAFFSLRTGALIIPTFLMRKKDDSFRLSFEKPIENEKTENGEADIKNAVKKYIGVTERYIKSFPDQWYAFKKVWE